MLEQKDFSKSALEAAKTFKPQPMVGWYDPRQLFITGIKTVISSVFGSYSDKREIQAALSAIQEIDYSDKNEIWIDYLSDTGDGFKTTFTMANVVSWETINLKDKAGKTHETQKGDILILGGDQVYPVATRTEYLNRFRGPFEAACINNKTPREADLFAVPGNHDWYDGLSNFIKIFCQNRGIGKWNTKQKRSYFALRLPHGFWLWGIDIQLEADIDNPQLKFFEEIGNTKMKEGDKIILCTAEPSWTHTTKRKTISYENLAFFERKYIDSKKFELVASIAGDLHHYSRYSLKIEGLERHKLTAGGGGAFLHPTHNLPEQLTQLREGDFELKKTYPLKKDSRKLSLFNLLFPWFNIYFAIFMGVFYLFFAWLLQVATHSNGSGESFIERVSKIKFAWGNVEKVLAEIIDVIPFNPSIVVTIVLVIFAMAKFTDTNSSRFDFMWLVGGLHGVIHLLNGFVLIWFFAYLTYPSSLPPWLMLPLFSLEILVVGGATGCIIMGVYLLICNLLIGIHDNEAFSSLRWTGHKNFLRMHISAEGLTIYPVGVEKTTKWKKVSDELYKPDNLPTPELIDDIIKIKK